MPFIADVTEEENQQLIHYFLNKAVTSETVKTEDDFMHPSDIKWVSVALSKLMLFTKTHVQFLSSVEGTTVNMSESASKLIRNYFVASRRVRAIGGSVDECLPIGAVQSMFVLN
jgi:hypothetical protein